MRAGDVWADLERQFPNNLMLRGYPTWNVPRHVTLSSFPPQLHISSAKKEDEIELPNPILCVESTQFSPLVLTCSEDGEINVWNTELRLFRAARLNFFDITSMQTEDHEEE